MELIHEIKDNIIIFKIKGDLQSPQALDVDKKAIELIDKEQKNRVIIDLSGCEHIDSTGLGVLVSIKLHCKKNKILFATVGVNDKIKKTFTVTEMSTFLNIHDNYDKLL